MSAKPKKASIAEGTGTQVLPSDLAKPTHFVGGTYWDAIRQRRMVLTSGGSTPMIPPAVRIEV